MDQRDRARTSLLWERCGVAASIGSRGKARAFPLLDLLPCGAAHGIDELVVQDREEPSAQIGAGLPQMFFGDGADQAVLDEIVSAFDVPSGQGARITAQSRDLRFQQSSVIRHRITIVVARHPGKRGPPLNPSYRGTM